MVYVYGDNYEIYTRQGTIYLSRGSTSLTALLEDNRIRAMNQ